MKHIITQQLTLLDALAYLSPESSKTTLRSWLKDGRITVDGKIIKIANTPVYRGQKIALGVRPRFIKEDNLRIYYEDHHIVVIEKPDGLLSVATNFEKGDTAHAILKRHFRPQRVFVVHRLDQDTSGVMLFALSEKGRDNLKDAFEEHALERAYIAVVDGQLKSESGTWESYVYEDDNYVVHTTNDPTKGRLARTHYEVMGITKKFTLLKLRLETGRKNQIRVHCRDAGHAVVGDKKYGSYANPLKRLCLHACLLEFDHPITKQKMRFESPAPESFYNLVKN